MTHYVLSPEQPIPDALKKGKKKMSYEWKQRLQAHRDHLKAIKPLNLGLQLKQWHRCNACRTGRHDECEGTGIVSNCDCYPCPGRRTGFQVYPDDFSK